MKLPANTIIVPDKISKYLLTKREDDDKSQYLAKAGYTLSSAVQWLVDLRQQILPKDAIFLETNTYGDVYEISGNLTGPNGKRLAVTTIWMTETLTRKTKFVTLFPMRRK
jgi:hypothetical protein